MPTPFDGFCGPSYQLDTRYAAIERLVNWLVLPNESAEEKKFRTALAPLPGNAAFSDLPVPAPFNQPCRGLLELRDVAYGVNGTVVFSINENGKYTNIGSVVSDGKPVSMTANGNGQIFIASAGHGYVIPLNGGAGSLVEAGSGFLGAAFATFQDGYIIVLTPDSHQYQISGNDTTPLGDATAWDASNVSIQAGQADLLRALISTREYLWLLGAKRSQVHVNVGSQGIGAFPFANYNETFIETGIAAPFSLADAGDSLIWIGEDKRGRRCWQAHSFQPERISTFAVQQKWDSYYKVSDAVAFPFLWQDHLLYQVTFPSAFQQAARIPFDKALGPMTGATWLYDDTASRLLGRPIWMERSYQTALGYANARSEQFYCFAYGKHLVGSTGIDGNPGAIYQYGNTGTKDTAPKFLLRWSNDGGNAFGVEYPVSMGAIGKYGQRMYVNRCGYARDRVFWLRYTGETECGTDINGNQAERPIVRDRICPHVWDGNNRVIYHRIEFEAARGIGSVDGSTPNPFSVGIVGAELTLTEMAS